MVFKKANGPPKKGSRIRQKKARRHTISSSAGNKESYGGSKYTKKEGTFTWGLRNMRTNKKNKKPGKSHKKRFK
jgi:hypothetical protein